MKILFVKTHIYIIILFFPLVCILLYFFLSTNTQEPTRIISREKNIVDSCNPDTKSQNFIDDRKGSKKATKNIEFIIFMRNFHAKKKSNDREGMIKLASNMLHCYEYFDILFQHALASSLEGVKDLDLPWNPNESLDSGGFIEIALDLIAASQNKINLKKATLTKTQKKKILYVWRILYGNTLALMRSINDPRPTKSIVQEVMDKNMASLKIAELLDDPVLMSFSVLAGAWAFERLGEKDQSLSLRKMINNISIAANWPPINKNYDNKYKIIYPKFDNYGNSIPESADEIH